MAGNFSIKIKLVCSLRGGRFAAVVVKKEKRWKKGWEKGGKGGKEERGNKRKRRAAPLKKRRLTNKTREFKRPFVWHKHAGGRVGLVAGPLSRIERTLHERLDEESNWNKCTKKRDRSFP